ncbi:MAG: hypothetical protein HOW97_18235, partial [Catenulispora sp.]|nr:hypothetical protein [Catenulispora sp.]
ARHEGVLTGPVSGAAALVGLRESITAKPGARVVAVLADGGDRHLDTVYDEGWLAARGLPAAVPTLSELRDRARAIAPITAAPAGSALSAVSVASRPAFDPHRQWADPS